MQTKNEIEKTCRQLFTEFKDRYTTDEVEKHPQIARLFTYLQHRCSIENGNYVHDPNHEISDLLQKFLRYAPKKKLEGKCAISSLT